MLALTERAVQAVKEIVSSSADAPETGGLRVAAQDAETPSGFRLSVAAQPAADDEVVEEDGARLFLDRSAALMLDDKVLDAEVGQNQVQFRLEEQGAD